MKKDLENIVERGDRSAILKSGCDTVREVWGLIKQLQMSEANLKRRLEESEAIREGKTLDDMLAEMKERYEQRIAELQDENEKQADELIKEMDAVVVQANHEIKSLRKELAELKNKEDDNAQIQEDSRRWLDATTIFSSLFIGVLNKWLSMISIKCVFWELLHAITIRQASKEVTPKSRLRAVVYTVVFSIRLARQQGTKQQTVCEAERCESIVPTERGKKLYGRLMVAASHHNAVAGRLLRELADLRVGDDRYYS